MSAQRAVALLREASALHRQGRREQALPLFREGLALAPKSAESWYEFGFVLRDLGQYPEALEAFEQALAHGVERAEEVELQRAVLFADHLRRDDAARSALESALRLRPDFVPALLNFGNLLEQRGDKSGAIACYERLLALPPPGHPGFAQLRWVGLSRIAIMRPPESLDDPLLSQLEQAAEQASQDQFVRAGLLFALGHSLDRLGAHVRAFDAFARGNRCLLRLHGRRYDRSYAARLTDALMAAFPGRAAPRAPCTDGANPLFVCGMFRSGSTLVEQVLAAHPAVTPGGELDWLLRITSTTLAPFPQTMAQLGPDAIARLAHDYRTHLAKLFPTAGTGRYITDKRPENFQLIGLIKQLFPTARIVHTIRNPLDNGLSVYMQHMNLDVTPYANDLGDIGHYYGEYRRLMAHWKALYPEDIHDFDYDAFIAEPERRLRALLEFLGLPWDARCLEFHQLRNTVKTASYWQVRRPLYGSASGRWRHYDAQLEPLRQALRNAGVHLAG